MKTHQVKELNGKVFQVQDKATGIPYTQLSEKQLKNIPKEHIDNFYKDISELERNGLSIDISGGKSNIFYDPKKGFQFIDLGIGEMPTASEILKGFLPIGMDIKGYKPVDISKTSGSAMRTNPPKNIDELLALPEEEILNLTGKQKWVWENFKNSSLPKERIEKELARALSREESLIGQFTVPQNTVPRELRDFVKEGRKDAIDWIKSDEWLKRRIKATGESKEQAEAMRKIMLEDLKSTTVDFKNVQGKKVSEKGFQYTDKGNSIIALGFGDDAVNKSLRGNAEHEFIHAGTNNPKSFQGIKMDDIYPEIPSHLDPNTKRFLEYLNQNTEKQVRGVRTLQYLKRSGKWDGSSEITDDMINHLKDNYFEWSSNGMGNDVANLISNVKDKKTLKDFLNNVYTTSGIIAGGAAGSAGIKD